jgi:hypothetical protein
MGYADGHHEDFKYFLMLSTRALSMGKTNAFFVWFIAIIFAIFSGWLFKIDDLAAIFIGFLLFCFSATVAGYQMNKARAASPASSHPLISSMPKGAMGIGAILMCIPALVGYLIP